MDEEDEEEDKEDKKQEIPQDVDEAEEKKPRSLVKIYFRANKQTKEKKDFGKLLDEATLKVFRIKFDSLGIGRKLRFLMLMETYDPESRQQWLST